MVILQFLYNTFSVVEKLVSGRNTAVAYFSAFLKVDVDVLLSLLRARYRISLFDTNTFCAVAIFDVRFLDRHVFFWRSSCHVISFYLKLHWATSMNNLRPQGKCWFWSGLFLKQEMLFKTYMSVIVNSMFSIYIFSFVKLEMFL